MSNIVELNSVLSSSLVKVSGISMSGIVDINGIPSISFNDDFTGSNGDPPDPTRWSQEIDTGTNSAVINSNKLRMSVSSGGDQAWQNTVKTFAGDFDVEVGIDLVTYPTASFWDAMISALVLDGANAGWYYEISRGAAIDQFIRYTEYTPSSSYDEYATTITSCKVRLKRVGTAITGYYDYGSGWVRRFNNFTPTSGTMAIRMKMTSGDTNPAAVVDFDNFAEVITPATDYEDLHSFTEVDSASDIEVFPYKVSFDTMQQVANSYVYKDYGAGYFGDFIIEYEMEITNAGASGLCHNLAITNTVPGTVGDLSAANDALFQFSYGNAGNLRITVKDYNTDDSDDYFDGGTSSAHLYCRLSRSSTTLTLQIYSDSARTSLVDTLTCTCETGTKRYLYVLGSWDTAGTSTISGYTQNVKIVAH